MSFESADRQNHFSAQRFQPESSVAGGVFELFEGERFYDLAELERFLSAKLDLEEASITLQPNFVNADEPEPYGAFSTMEPDGDSALIVVPSGYRSRIAIHLIAGESRRNWPPRGSFGAIAAQVLDVFRRFVSDSLVSNLSEKGEGVGVSLFLDNEGIPESVPESAKEFFQKHFPSEALVGEGVPHTFSSYLKSAAEKAQAGVIGICDRGFTFTFLAEKSMLSCHLRQVGSNGYLLTVLG